MPKQQMPGYEGYMKQQDAKVAEQKKAAEVAEQERKAKAELEARIDAEAQKDILYDDKIKALRPLYGNEIQPSDDQQKKIKNSFLKSYSKSYLIMCISWLLVLASASLAKSNGFEGLKQDCQKITTEKLPLALGISQLIIMTMVIVPVIIAGNRRKKEVRNVIKYSDVLETFERLKQHNVDVPELIKKLTPEIKKALSSLSEIDRGYFDNLMNGGLNDADYEVCVSIIEGYLRSHPEEYNKIKEIIDESTIPEELRKKYDKNKTISFFDAHRLLKSRKEK